MNRFCLLCVLTAALTLAACGTGDESVDTDTSTLTKDEARTMSGKGDHRDWCAIFDWYGDGVCDTFCTEPDPDCAQSCDDGSSLNPLCDIRELCADGETSALINGCFECVDEVSCEAPEPSCDDGSSVHPLCDIRQACATGTVSAVQNGCFACVDPTTCEVPDATGQMCGGIAGLLCPSGYDCLMSVGMCNVADAAGTCAPQNGPGFCPAVAAPVCGCDGVTYSNSCKARNAGASVDHAGPCGALPPGRCGGFAGLLCAADEFCAYEPTQMCGAADQLGTCSTKPEACITLYDPVCGCDGSTYSNSCFAAAAGVSVAEDDACP